MVRTLDDLLDVTVPDLEALPEFDEVFSKYARQVCRAEIIELLVQSPEVRALGIESVAFLFEDTIATLSQMVIILAKLYKEQGMALKTSVDLDQIRAEENYRFNLSEGEPQVEPQEEEEECQSSQQTTNKTKLLN